MMAETRPAGQAERQRRQNDRSNDPRTEGAGHAEVMQVPELIGGASGLGRNQAMVAMVATAMNVEIWSDVVCPWCYIGKRRFERAVASFGHPGDVTITYRSFELDPDAPAQRSGTQAEHLARKYGMTIAQAEQASQQMTQRAAADGLEFPFDLICGGNTFDAHRLRRTARSGGSPLVELARPVGRHPRDRRGAFAQHVRERGIGGQDSCRPGATASSSSVMTVVHRSPIARYHRHLVVHGSPIARYHRHLTDVEARA